jgi:hypothetical protein
MEACAEHVPYQLPNELDAIQNFDAGLQAAIDSVRTDDGPAGKRNDFEVTVIHLSPYDVEWSQEWSWNNLHSNWHDGRCSDL